LRKIYSRIGIAQKAGKVSSGTMAARSSILRNRACLVIMSADISNNTRESLITACQKQKIPWIVLGNKFELGTCVGKAYRVAVTINEQGIADSIIELVKSRGEGLNSTGVVEWPK
jgi:ribosomal protein L7Ae-like RNA K-turn-binding protein